MAENPTWIAFALEDGVVYHTYTRMAPDRDFVVPYYRSCSTARRRAGSTSSGHRGTTSTRPPTDERARDSNRTMVLLFGLVVVAWAVTVERMQGMDAGPGTDLGGLGWYLGIWVTMTAAMMLPSEAPAALLVARLTAACQRGSFSPGTSSSGPPSASPPTGSSGW